MVQLPNRCLDKLWAVKETFLWFFIYFALAVGKEGVFKAQNKTHFLEKIPLLLEAPKYNSLHFHVC